jgi:hypothetical protein
LLSSKRWRFRHSVQNERQLREEYKANLAQWSVPQIMQRRLCGAHIKLQCPHATFVYFISCNFTKLMMPFQAVIISFLISNCFKIWLIRFKLRL